MAVSSKWYVSRPLAEDDKNVYLMPVCRGVENREWAQATPAGEMRMLIQNAAAREQFVYGEEYEVIFRHVAKPAPGDGHEVDVVEQYGWNPATGQNDKVYWVCGTCGSYARLADDGQPDWSAHEEMFGKPTL